MDNEITNLMAWFKEEFINRHVTYDIVTDAGGKLEQWNDNADEWNDEYKDAIEEGEENEMRLADHEDIREWIEEGWCEYWSDMIDEWVSDEWDGGEMFYLDDEGTTLAMLMISDPEEDGCKWQVAGKGQLLTTFELLEEMGNPERTWFDEELANPSNQAWVDCWRPTLDL